MGEDVIPENNHILYRKAEILYDHANQLMTIHFNFKEYNDEDKLIFNFNKTLRFRYVFRFEMEHLISLSGFKLETVYGNFNKKLYDYESGDMIFIAKKISD